MVCRLCGAVLAAVATVIVNLRDTDDIAMSFAVDDAPVQNWDDVSRSLDQAVGTSEEQRAALLQDVVSVVNNLRQQGSNASTYIKNESDKKLLDQVLVILEENIFGAMDTAHKNDEKMLNNQVNVTMRGCNEKLQKRLGKGGDVYRIEQQLIDGRNRHVACRQTEVEAWKDWRQSIEDFDNFRSSIEPRELKQFPDDNHRTMQAFDAFFLEQDSFFEWYEKRRVLYVGYYSRESANETNYKEIKGDCTDNQTHFESEYCIFSFARNHACKEQQECYQNATKKYEELVATAKAGEANRKQSWKAGNLIIQNLKCIIGNVTCNVTGVTDYKRYTLEIPTKAPDRKCTPEQLYEASSDRSPGGQVFVDQEYNSETIAFEARPRSVMIECQGEPKMPPGREGDDCADQTQTDIRGNGCAFYNENPVSCGVYDTSEFTAGCVCCKCFRKDTDCENQAPKKKKKTLPTLYTPGTYTVWKEGQLQKGGNATIGCDGKFFWRSLTDKLRWDGVKGKCSSSFKNATFWIQLEDKKRWDCLRREGDNMKGVRTLDSGSKTASVEYKFSGIHKNCDDSS